MLDVAVGESWVAQLSASSERDWPYRRDVRLRWLDRDGQALGEIPLSDLANASFGGEVLSRRLVVLVTEPRERDDASRSAQRLLLFDPVTGALEPLEAPAVPPDLTLHPVQAFLRFPSRPTWAPEAGSLATKLYFTSDRSLVLLDAERGTLRLVQAAPGSRNTLPAP
jgi:hypothetical protein